jgi:16S rRNA (guanine527-N7)-methyltransferase
VKRRFLTEAEAEAIGEAVRLRLERVLHDGDLNTPVASFSAKMATFATHLALWGQKINLTAAPTDPDEILFHVMDSLAPVWIAAKQTDSILARALAPGRRLIDFGSGAGFPGLILAAAMQVETTLVESRRKRASFLEAASAAMGLFDVIVVQSRMTPANVSRGFDLVTVRAVGISPEFFAIASAALRPGGVAIAYLSAGQEVDREVAVSAGLAELISARYDISRGDERVARTLALWLKES